MKKVLLLSICFVVSLSKANDVVAVGVIAMSLIPPSVTFTLDNNNQDNNVPNQELIKTTPIKNIIIEDDASKLRRSYLDCIDETHVKPDLVKRFKAGNWGQDHPSLKRWALCVLVKMDMMSRQGVYRYDTAMNKIRNDDKEIVDDLLNRCLSKKPMPPPDIAWNYLKCHHRRDRKNKFPSLGIIYSFK